MKSVFAQYDDQFYPYRYHGTLSLVDIAGGIPSDPNKARGWLATVFGSGTAEDRLESMVSEVMLERGISKEDAVEEVMNLATLVGFKHDATGLYYEGRQLKAALKEAVSVAANAGKITTKGWGNPDNANYKKGIKAWFPEHVFVVEKRLHLRRDGQPIQRDTFTSEDTPDHIDQQFIHTSRGSSIQYQEIVEDADIHFTVETDHKFPDEQWAAIWTALERNGVGASRSRDFGRGVITRWDLID